MTQDEIKNIINYNPDTGLFIWNKNVGTKIKPGMKAGTTDRLGYLRIIINKKMYFAHRLAWLYIYGYFPKIVDHINGNPGDNRLSNLRPATQSQNCMNKKIQSNNKSGVRGVHWSAKAKKWVASIQIGPIRKYLGLFDDLEFAELVIKEARHKYYGEFARET